RARDAAADVEYAADRFGLFEGEQEGLRYIVDMDEIPPLIAILEDHRRLAIQQSRGKDGEHAGIGIGQRLSRTVDIEEPERDALHGVFGQGLKKDSGPVIVDGDVAVDRVHALADADFRRQVNDLVDTDQGGVDKVTVADVTGQELDLAHDRIRSRAGPMNLFD